MTIPDPLFVGIVAGGAWSLVNLWGLTRISTVWLRQAHRGRTLAWFLFKFPCLYAIAMYLLTRPAVSPMGFGIGFTVMLVAAGVVTMRRARIVHGQ